jgi:hypothetical protein
MRDLSVGDADMGETDWGAYWVASGMAEEGGFRISIAGIVAGIPSSQLDR